MTDYVRITDYAAKDTLLTGDPAKLVKGTEIGADFDAVAVAVATKADTASPTFTGTVTAAALTTTGNTILGDASTDTLNVGNGGIVKDASGNVGIGVTPSARNNTTFQIKDGVGFPATQVPSSDANTLDDYEESTWIPVDASGAGLTFTSVSATYEKIGRQVTARFTLTFPATADATAVNIGGLPFAVANDQGSRQGFISGCSESTALRILPNAGLSTFSVATATTGNITNATMSGDFLYGTLVYNV